MRQLFFHRNFFALLIVVILCCATLPNFVDSVKPADVKSNISFNKEVEAGLGLVPEPELVYEPEIGTKPQIVLQTEQETLMQAGTRIKTEAKTETESEISSKPEPETSSVTKLEKELEVNPEAERLKAIIAFPPLNEIADAFVLLLQTVLNPTGEPSGICQICEIFVNYLIVQIRAIPPLIPSLQESLFLAQLKLLVCPAVLAANIASYRVCEGTIDRLGPVIYFIIYNRPSLTAHAACGYILQPSGCLPDDPYLQWDIDTMTSFEDSNIGIGIKSFSTSNSSVFQLQNNLPLQTPPGTNKFVHFTDIHYDNLYTIGAQNDCEDKTLCCHIDSTPPVTNSSMAAGKFGDKHSCDSPLILVKSLFKSIKTKHSDAKAILFSGDINDHGLLYSTLDSVSAAFTDVFEAFKDEIGDSIPLVSILGNHDTDRVNCISVNDSGILQRFNNRDIIYEKFFSASNTIPDTIPPNQETSFKDGGFYTKIITPNIKFIVMNNLPCYVLNFWALFNQNDPEKQLKRLKQELQAAKNQGQYVFIICHIPPSHQDCSIIWRRNFIKILNLYPGVVKAIFPGHTHNDRSANIGNVMEFTAASVKSYNGRDPSYSVYYINEATGKVVDTEKWKLKLDAANNANPDQDPQWLKASSTRELFGPPEISIENTDVFAERMGKNKTFFDV